MKKNDAPIFCEGSKNSITIKFSIDIHKGKIDPDKLADGIAALMYAMGVSESYLHGGAMISGRHQK